MKIKVQREITLGELLAELLKKRGIAAPLRALRALLEGGSK